MSDPVISPAAAPVSVLDAATANAQDQALADRLTKAEAAIAALQAGQPQPPQNTPSPDGTAVTTIGGGSIVDAKLRAFTLVAPPAGMTSPGIAVNGVYSTNTQAVARLYAKGGVCFQQNTAGSWYNMPNGAWAAATDPTGTTPVPPNPGTGSWTMSGGRLYRAGALCIPYGPAILDSEMSSIPASKVRQLFPGASINAINLCSGADGNGYATAQSFAATTAWIDDAIAKGFMVMLSDYVPGQPYVRSGADLANSLNWYAQYAKRYASSNAILFTCENEVNGDLNSAWQQIYDTIRNNGSSAPIFFEARCGNAGDLGGFAASLFNGKHLVGANVHVYPWEFNTSSGNQADYDNACKGYVQKWRNFAPSPDGGPLCVIMGEGGNSTSGSGSAPDDPVINGKYAVTQAILNITGRADGFCASFPFIWDWHGQVSPGRGDADTLVLNNALTPMYGVQCAGFVAPTS